MFKTSDFTPAKGLSNPHIQTMVAKWLNRKQVITTFTEILALPDGDFVDLAWTEIPTANNTKPIIVLLHGLHGSQHSHYIKSIFTAIKQKGWIGVLIHFRGCSGKPNRLAHSYHGAYTYDINYFTEQLKTRYRYCKFAIMGYSLGGNVLAKYLAETQSSYYTCAAIICSPLDLASCSSKINKGLSKIYQKYLLDMLKTSTAEKIKSGLINHVSLNDLKQIKSLWSFDEKITAPLNGFNSAAHYYAQSSSISVLKNITTPCLIIHTQDDPFVSQDDIFNKKNNLNDLPDNITFEISAYGGHVGFLTGNTLFKPKYWLAARIPQFLQDYI